jgi:putative membrane protein
VDGDRRSAAVKEVLEVPYYMDHSGWDLFGWFLPMVLSVLLVALAVWLVVRSTGERPQASVPPVWPPPTVPPTDAALEQARLRYARGEIDREEFIRLSRDLGGAAPETPTGAAPSTPPR